MAPDPRGLIVAAPASGSGKTLITQALLRLLKNTGHRVRAAKTGPDYIDPHFHARASGESCLNLDSWAMRPGLLRHVLDQLAQDCDLVLCEGVMGLFDGASVDDADADGSTASLARTTGWPVILIVDAAKQAASVAALIRGFVTHDGTIDIVGIIFNRVGSPAHEALLRKACAKHLPQVAIFGALPRQSEFVLPQRHLGLVQAEEHDNHESFLEMAASWLAKHLDMANLVASARPARTAKKPPLKTQIPPLGDHIAVAQDKAFAFCYPTVLQGWRDAGAALSMFSPLAGDVPAASATAVYLPGGYPELHAAQLAANGFLPGLCAAAARNAFIYGECGGFMVLGRGMVDADGMRHQMAGLLPIETSFAEPKLHLGYRQVKTLGQLPFAGKGQRFRGHEFHYASLLAGTEGEALFEASTASNGQLGSVGQISNTVAGSFIHLIDQVAFDPA